MGAPDEIASMMDSFATYINDYMYVGSSLYPLVDNTNRHGISHGVYADSEYGRPLNFYKTIAAVDFLTFVSSFRANISWFAPDPTPDSRTLAAFYMALMAARKGRVR
jgi:hypothetical protein